MIWPLIVACGGSTPTEKEGPGAADCYFFESGDACALDTCCNNDACWYQASDGEIWTCEDPGLCRDSEAEAARTWCEVQESTSLTFVAPCRWEGEWEILTAHCGEFTVDDIVTLYRDTRIELVTPDPDEGGCDITIDWVHRSGCLATEHWTIPAESIPTPATMDMQTEGIASCDPEIACALGDHQTTIECRVGSRTANVLAELVEAPNGDITIEGPWHPDVLPLCASPLSITLTPYVP